jgi:hypothetical protein
MTRAARRRTFLLVLAASLVIALWSTAAAAGEPRLATVVVAWLAA